MSNRTSLEEAAPQGETAAVIADAPLADADLDNVIGGITIVGGMPRANFNLFALNPQLLLPAV
jgi:hypothetical protein